MTETPPGRPPQPPTAPGSPAPAHGDGPTRPDGPTGRTELRDRLREALTTERWGSEHALGEHGTGHSFYAPCGICQGDLAAIIRLVMPVVQAALAEVERQRDEALAAVADEQQRADERRTELLEERDEALDALADAEKRAEQAGRERDKARDAIADERRGRLAVEATVRRVRLVCMPPTAPDLRAEVLAALDAEQPKETP